MPLEVLEHDDDFGTATARDKADPTYQKWDAAQADMLRSVSSVDELSFDWSKTPTLELVGGIDISHVKGSDVAVTSLVVLEFSTMKVVYESYKPTMQSLPYLPGLASFREIGPVLELIRTVRDKYPKYVPQVLLVEGNGKLHPRKFGLASHVGVASGIPTIGVSKRFLKIDGISEESVKQVFATGAEAVSLVGEYEKQWGLAFAPPKARDQPIYISIGHKVSLKTSAEIVKACTWAGVPEPIRKADQLSRDYINDMERQGRLTHQGSTLVPIQTPSSSSKATAIHAPPPTTTSKATAATVTAPPSATTITTRNTETLTNASTTRMPQVQNSTRTAPVVPPAAGADLTERTTSGGAYRSPPQSPRRNSSPRPTNTPRIIRQGSYTPAPPQQENGSGLGHSGLNNTSQSTIANTSRREDGTVVNTMAPTLSNNNMLVPLKSQPRGWWENMYGYNTGYQSGWNNSYGGALTYWNPWAQWGNGANTQFMSQPVSKSDYQTFTSPSGAGRSSHVYQHAPAKQPPRPQSRQQQFSTMFTHHSPSYTSYGFSGVGLYGQSQPQHTRAPAAAQPRSQVAPASSPSYSPNAYSTYPNSYRASQGYGGQFLW